MPLRCGGFNCESLWSVQVCQLRAGFVKDEDEQEAMWEQQHELGAQKMYSLCSELGGLFLKVGVLGFARPFLIFRSSSLIFKCPHSHPPKKGRV